MSNPNSLAVSGIEGIGYVNGDRQYRIEFQRPPGDQVFQCQTVQKFHHDEGLTVLFIDLVNSADVGMVQSRGGFGLTLKASESLRIFGDVVRKKFKGHKAAEFKVFGFVYHAHATAAQFVYNAIVGDGLTDHEPLCANILVA